MKQRKFIKSENDLPLVTRFGVVRLTIISLNCAYVCCDNLPVESGRFNGCIMVKNIESKCTSVVDLYNISSCITIRREKLLLGAINRAIRRYHKQNAPRFERAEKIRINNRIFDIESVVIPLQLELSELLKQEQALS